MSDIEIIQLRAYQLPEPMRRAQQTEAAPGALRMTVV
jgi:hypothetical protein